MTRLAALTVLLAGAVYADGPRLFYSREFPGSVPPYISVSVTKSGDAEYREAVDDELPLKYKLSTTETEAVFALAEKLEYFKLKLESPAKVAFMGTKTFRFENGDQKGEAKFNYSENQFAQILQDWFERMCESAQHHIELERTVKYDRLGVMNALILLEGSFERERVVGATQFLPLLDRIIANENFMHAARSRASEIAEGIRSMQPK
jgi:hypothetical protein